MTFSLIDTHAHFSDAQFDLDRMECLERARVLNVDTIVEIADDPKTWEMAKNLAHKVTATAALPAQKSDRLPKMFWTCGFHPHYAQQFHDFDFASMIQAAADPLCVAVGEIGLDYVKSEASKEDQTALFRRTLEISAQINKPVVIHCRQAQSDMLRILKSFYGGTSRADLVQGVIHCFSGDIHFAQGCLELGFYLGVDGPLTYPSAKELRETLAQVPLDRLVLETDCPYLPPQSHRGKRNESAHLPTIAEKLAEIFNVSTETVAEKTSQNARKLYRILS